MGNKYKKLIKDTFIFAIGNIGSKLILFFLVPLYTAFMSREEYGTADLLFTVAELTLPFVSLVIFDALVRFGLSKAENRKNVLLASYIVLSCGAILTIILVPLFGLYKPISNWKWLLALYIIISGFNVLNMNYLKTKEKNAAYAAISITQTLLMALLNVLTLTVLHMGVDGYLLSYIVSSFVSLTLSSFIANVPKDLKEAQFDKRLLVDMIKYSAPLILNNISWWVVQSSDKMMIEAMMSPDDLGLYTVSAKIPALINVLINVFSQAWGISSIKEYEDSNDTSFYSKVFEYYSFICFGTGMLVIALIKPFMRMYVSEEFYESWRYVPLLIAAASFASISYYYGSLYGALKRTVGNMITTVLAAVVNIIVNLIAIPYIGVYGAALGTLVSYVVMATVRMGDIQRFIKLQINYCKLLIVSTLIIVQAIMVTLDKHGLIASIFAIIAFCVVNFKTIGEMAFKLKNALKRKKN